MVESRGRQNMFNVVRCIVDFVFLFGVLVYVMDESLSFCHYLVRESP